MPEAKTEWRRVGNLNDLLDLIDRRIEAALGHERRVSCELMQETIRTFGALAQEHIAQLHRDLDAKLAHLQTLLASRPPLDPPSGRERPN
jgi:hypothetical protein